MLQDRTSVPGMPLAAGLTIESLSSHTVDEKGRKAFVTHNPLDLLRKVRLNLSLSCPLRQHTRLQAVGDTRAII